MTLADIQIYRHGDTEIVRVSMETARPPARTGTTGDEGDIIVFPDTSR